MYMYYHKARQILAHHFSENLIPSWRKKKTQQTQHFWHCCLDLKNLKNIKIRTENEKMFHKFRNDILQMWLESSFDKT